MRPSILTLATVVMCALTTSAFFFYGTQSTTASDHQDSPLMLSRPGADITDVFLFPAADPKKVVLAMDVHPLIPAGQADTASFDPGVMYQLKIDTTGTFHEDKVIQFKATGAGADQTITVYGPAAPVSAGTGSTWVGEGQTIKFNTPQKLEGGMQVFAGPRKDPFYFDLTRFLQIIPDRDYKNQPNPPPPSARCFRKQGSDFLKDFNVLSFVVELPRTMLAGPQGKLGVIHMYATTSLPSASSNTYAQVERLARPAVKEATEAFKQHDATNRSTPWNDPALKASVYTFMTTVAGRSPALAKAVTATLIPDELAANLAATGPARYLAVETNGKSGLPVGIVRAVPKFPLGGIKKALGDPFRHFGGRDPSSPVMDLSLGVIFGSLGQKVGLAPDDHKETQCLTSDNVQPSDRGVTKTFPYIGPAI